MCGIIGGNWFTSSKQTHTHLQKIIHRGRDASIVDEIDSVFVGHNRLSIQDLSSTANQPMWNGDKTVCIVYNGELWDSNYTKELKDKITDNTNIKFFMIWFFFWFLFCLLIIYSKCN